MHVYIYIYGFIFVFFYKNQNERLSNENIENLLSLALNDIIIHLKKYP